MATDAELEALIDATPATDADIDAMIDAAPAPSLLPRSRAPGKAPSEVAAFGRGAVQGGTFGFADEAAGLWRSASNAPGDWLFEKLNPDAAKEPSAQAQYGTGRDNYRQDDEAAKAAHPYFYGGGELAGGVASSFIPGLGLARGAKLGATLGKTALAGGLAGAGHSTATDASGLALDTTIGAGLGAGLGGLGYGLGRLGAKAGRGVAAIDEKVAQNAAAEEAAVTSSARSEAGRAGSDTARQVEHVREAGVVRELTPEQAMTFHQEEQRLGKTAAENLIPSSARRAEKVAAYSDAMGSEAARTAANATQKLSAGELKNQAVPRLLRYGLPALGGALGLGGEGGLVGMGIGALAGAGMRPTMRSMLRLAQQPVVQRPLLSATRTVLGDVAAPGLQRAAGSESLRLNPQTLALIAALRGEPEAGQMAQREER